MATVYEAFQTKFPTEQLKFFLKSAQVQIDEWYFRLHYKTTTNLLLICAIMASLDQFINTRMMCDITQSSVLKSNAEGSGANIRQSVVDTYCYIKTTFSVPYYVNVSELHGNSYNQIKRVGVFETINKMTGEDWNSLANSQNDSPNNNNNNNPEIIYYAYYQWVPFFLFFQALTFYTPHYVWSLVENGKVQKLLQKTVQARYLTKDPKLTKNEIDKLGKYIWLCIDGQIYRKWIVFYLLCEFSNMFILIGNINLTNVFLGYEFTTYGPSSLFALINTDPELRTDPMSFVFPKLTKCTFNFFGPSGTIQQGDAICLPTLNIMNEKIYVFVWFWFVLLLFLTTIGLVIRLATLFSIRFQLFKLDLQMVIQQQSPNNVNRNNLNMNLNPEKKSFLRVINSNATNNDSPLLEDDMNRITNFIQELNVMDWILLRFIQMNLHNRMDKPFIKLLTRILFYKDQQAHYRSNTKLIT